MDEDALKNWIRDNVVIDVDNTDNYGPGLSVNIGLRFIGEEKPFCSEFIYIPEESI